MSVGGMNIFAPTEGDGQLADEWSSYIVVLHRTDAARLREMAGTAGMGVQEFLEDFLPAALKYADRNDVLIGPMRDG